LTIQAHTCGCCSLTSSEEDGVVSDPCANESFVIVESVIVADNIDIEITSAVNVLLDIEVLFGSDFVSLYLIII
jgi:hypothetical protein